MSVYISNDSTFSLSPDFIEELRVFTKNVLQDVKKSKKGLSVVFVNVPKIKRLNKQYRGIDDSTDILSFSPNSSESEIYMTNYLGDLIVSPIVVEQNSSRFGVSFKEELYRCIVHGILHLMGMDHKETLNLSEPIFIKQEKILKKLYS